MSIFFPEVFSCQLTLFFLFFPIYYFPLPHQQWYRYLLPFATILPVLGKNYGLDLGDTCDTKILFSCGTLFISVFKRTV